MRSGAALSLAALLVVACRGGKGAVLAESSSDLQPGANPGNLATLRLGSPEKVKGSPPATEFDVNLIYGKHGDEISIALQTQGETLEHELYETSSDAFRILSATDDSFTPAIDIVRFPAYDGESWEWNGKTIYAGISRPAQGTVTLSKDGTGLSSEVKLKIQADPGRPELHRRLRFWFEKGKGVVGRSFGDVSARRPVGEAWHP